MMVLVQACTSGDESSAPASSVRPASPAEVAYCQFADRADDIEDRSLWLSSSRPRLDLAHYFRVVDGVPQNVPENANGDSLYSLDMNLQMAITNWVVALSGQGIGTPRSELAAKEAEFIVAHNEIQTLCRRIGAL